MRVINLMISVFILISCIYITTYIYVQIKMI